MSSLKEPLYKRYRDWDAGQDDRTSQEEAAAKKKLGHVVVAAAAASAPAFQELVDRHLENAVLYLLFVYMFTLPKLDRSPPDPSIDTPAVLRDKRLLQQGEAAYIILGPLIGNIKTPVINRVAVHTSGYHERIRQVHDDLITEKYWCGTFVTSYTPQTPPLYHHITGEKLSAETPYVQLAPSGHIISRDDHIFLSALHVTYHFWDYIMAAFVEQSAQDKEKDTSIYAQWNRYWGTSTPTWRYVGATLFRRRIIQLRAMLLSTVSGILDK
jgi:hypothetical protein